MKNNETKLQIQCVLWFATFYGRLYNQKLLFHTPNGAKRGAIEGTTLKRMGMQRGIADLILLIANDAHHGLIIEIKTDKGSQSGDQKIFETNVTQQGYKYVIVRTVIEFIHAVQSYLQGTPHFKKMMYHTGEKNNVRNRP